VPLNYPEVYYDYIAINAYHVAAHSAVILKAESMADKIEWMKKIRGIIQSKGGSVKGSNTPEGGPIRQSHSDGSLVSSTICLTCVLVHLFSVKLLELLFRASCASGYFYELCLFCAHVLLS
jgi:hypothetical protein